MRDIYPIVMTAMTLMFAIASIAFMYLAAAQHNDSLGASAFATLVAATVSGIAAHASTYPERW